MGDLAGAELAYSLRRLAVGTCLAAATLLCCLTLWSSPAEAGKAIRALAIASFVIAHSALGVTAVTTGYLLWLHACRMREARQGRETTGSTAA